MRRSFIMLVAVFCMVEAVLGVLLHTPDGLVGMHFSYLSVLFAFLFCFLFIGRYPAYIFTQIALLFTVAADTILVFQHSDYTTLAMCFFSVTQVAYAIRLHTVMPAGVRPYHLAARVLFSSLAIGAVLVVVGKAADALAVISLFYFANLVLNAAFAFADFRKNPLLAIGLFLFVLCDIFVGFSMLGGYLSLPDTRFVRFLVSPPINMAWVFYLPSQAILGISLLPYKKAA